MNLAGVDLNLLTVFDAVMTERNVTRAAGKIGMSQPAVSNALTRLRHLLKDDLFVRGTEGMRPTPRAVELAGPIRGALSELETALRPSGFDPATSTRTFRMVINDYVVSTLMPTLAYRMMQAAPGVNLHTVSDTARLYDLLDAQDVDFGVTAEEVVPDRFDTASFVHDSFYVLMRNDHPLAQKDSLSAEDYAAAKHLLVTPKGDVYGFVDDELAKLGLKRRIALSITFFASAPCIVASSDMILTIPARIATRYAGLYNLKRVPCPVMPPEMQVNGKLIWHKKFGQHPAMQWFRGFMLDCAREMVDLDIMCRSDGAFILPNMMTEPLQNKTVVPQEVQNASE